MPVYPRKNFRPGFLSAVIMIAVIGWLTYADTFSAPFVFDDIQQIVENPFIRMTAVTPSEIAGTFKSFSSNRPLANLSLAVNYYLHGHELFGYHLVNLLIHLATALLVFIVTRQTLSLLKPEQPAIFAPAPLLAALLWLANPLHIQSVTYVVQRMNSLAALFYLLSLACYIQARRSQRNNRGRTRFLPFFGLCILAGFLGLVSKETAATLPFMILAYEWYFFRNLDLSWLKKQRWWLYAGLPAILGLGLIYMEADPAGKLAAMYDKQSFTMSQRLLTQPLVVVYYISLLVFPHPDRLMLVYDFPLSTGLLTPPATLPALAAIAAMTVLIVVVARRDRLTSFALLWFLITLAVESTFLGLALIFEHRTYLPSVFPVIAVTFLMLRFLRPSLKSSLVPVLTAGILIIGGAVWTHQRNLVWCDDLSLWQDNALKTPANAPVLNNLGMAYQAAGKDDRAMAAYQQALELDPHLEGALNNMGAMLRDRGDPEAALPFFKKAVQLTPHYHTAWYNLGLSWFDMENLRQAAEAFEKAVTHNPFDEKAHNNLGLAYMQQGYPDQALNHFRRALGININYKETINNIGVAQLRRGKTDRALAAFEKAMEIDPFYLDAYNNIRRVTALDQKYGQQIRQLEDRLGRHPENAALSYQLGKTYENADRTFLALSQYQTTLELQPDHIHALNRLSSLYAEFQRYEEAAEIFKTMAELRPDTAVIHYNLACMYARANRTEKAVTALKKAIEQGYANFDHLQTDPDLENIRDTEYYRELLKESKPWPGESPAGQFGKQ